MIRCAGLKDLSRRVDESFGDRIANVAATSPAALQNMAAGSLKEERFRVLYSRRAI